MLHRAVVQETLALYQQKRGNRLTTDRRNESLRTVANRTHRDSIRTRQATRCSAPTGQLDLGKLGIFDNQCPRHDKSGECGSAEL